MTVPALRSDPRPEPQERQLPQNLDAEQALLAGLLLRNAAYDDVAEILRPEHFADALHGRIFAAIGKLVGQGTPANPVTLKAHFDQDAALIAAGGARYLVDLASAAVTTFNLGDYAREIVDHAKRRMLIEIGELAIREAHIVDLDVKVDDLIGSVAGRLEEVSGIGLVGPEAEAIGPVMMSVIERIQDGIRTGRGPVAVQTGIESLDRRLAGGLYPPDLILLAGRPSMGKTAAGYTIATNVARAGIPVAFFSMEMSRAQLAERQIASATGISVEKQRMCDVDEIGMLSIMDAQRDLSELPLYVDDTPALTVPQIRARAKRLLRRHRVGLIVIDYLGLMRPAQPRRSGNRNEEVGDISSALKALAKELDLPIVALSQLSRANESREDKRPQLSDLRDSGSLEQDADVVIFVHREEYYLSRQEPKPRAGEDETKFSARVADWHTAMAKVEGRAEFIIAKLRQGRIGIAECRFDGAKTTFHDL